MVAVNDLHFMPIVWEFLAATEARHIGAGKLRSRRKPLARPFCNRKAEILVVTTKQYVKQTRHKITTPKLRVFLEALILPTQAILYYRTCPNVHISSCSAVLLH